MGRHSSDAWVKLTARVPKGHQGFWDIIRDLRTFTVRDIDQRSNVAKATVQDFVGRLVKGGYIRHVATQATGAKVYDLVADQPEAPALRRDGTPAQVTGLANEQMWRTMAMLGDFTAADLAIAASTDTVPVGRLTARDYCLALHRAGYLVTVDGGVPRRASTYRLLPSRRTGPRAPQIQKTKWVFDPNTGHVAGHGEPAGGGA